MIGNRFTNQYSMDNKIMTSTKSTSLSQTAQTSMDPLMRYMHLARFWAWRGCPVY